MNKILMTLLLSLFSFSSFAENSVVKNGYEVHYNALSSSFLDPKVAKSYQIPRSKTKGFINIAIRKLNEDKSKLSTAVEAEIILTAKNFYGQDKDVELRKITENDGAIYYVGTFPVSSREMIKFKAQVKPHNSDVVVDLKFDKEFFTD
jgi:hypothetical protein